MLQFPADWGDGWQAIGSALDASVFSDEGGCGEQASFTGAFIGMLAFDSSGAALPADFETFSYTPALGAARACQCKRSCA